MPIFSRNWICDKFKIVLVIFLFSMTLRKKLSASDPVEMLMKNHIIKSRTFIMDLFPVGVKD